LSIEGGKEEKNGQPFNLSAARTDEPKKEGKGKKGKMRRKNILRQSDSLSSSDRLRRREDRPT